MSNLIYYTADDEQPNCEKCINYDPDMTCKECGDKYKWCAYIRIAENGEEK